MVYLRNKFSVSKTYIETKNEGLVEIDVFWLIFKDQQ